jgi:arsenate reductase (glutaredoxin)
MFTIYHNPKCRKSRAGLDYLKEKNLEFQVVEYLKTPMSREVFKDILMKLNKAPKELIRTQEDIFKERYRGKNFTEEEWITILLENPKLIQRPIVVKGYRAVVGEPASEIDKLI